MISKDARKLLNFMASQPARWFQQRELYAISEDYRDNVVLDSLHSEGYLLRLEEEDVYIEADNPYARPPYSYRISDPGRAFLEEYGRAQKDALVNRALAVAAILISIVALFKP